MDKDIIYIDVDDEITSVIEKVHSSKSRNVYLVLPKRATVFQSVVNMKLLKRKSEAADKRVVLVTTETSLLPLAGSTGVLVSKTLSSNPEVPAPPMNIRTNNDVDEDEPIQIESTSKRDFSGLKQRATLKRPIGDLDEESRGLSEIDKQLGDIDIDDEKESSNKTSRKEKRELKKRKHSLKVPSFDRFKKFGFIAVISLTVIIIAGWYLLNVLPTATITISTNAQNINSNINFSLSTTTSTLDASKKILPAKLVNGTKSLTSTIATTGSANLGPKAKTSSGVVFKIANCSTTKTPDSIPVGWGVKQGSYTYITNETMSWTFSSYNSGTGCLTFTSNSTGLTAQSGGSSYNVSNATFSGSYNGMSFSGTGSAIGGDDNVVKIVSQQDITTASKNLTQNNQSFKTDLNNQLSSQGLYNLDVTFQATSSNATPSVAIGSQADNVTVTETVTYSEYGVNKSDLDTLLANAVKSQSNGQSILDDGLSSANFALSNGVTDLTHLTIQATAIVGPDIDVNKIKSEAIGQKSGVIQSSISNDQNITGVKVKFSPFYVSQAPGNASKITVIIEKPTRN